MKTIVLLMVLVIGFSLPTFSQLNSPFKTNRLSVDTTSPNFSLKNRMGTLSFVDSIELASRLMDKNYLDPKYKYEFLHLPKKRIGIIKTPLPIDNMVCVKPKGNFPMPICKPDSTINYTLKIKSFKTYVR